MAQLVFHVDPFFGLVRGSLCHLMYAGCASFDRLNIRYFDHCATKTIGDLDASRLTGVEQREEID